MRISKDTAYNIAKKLLEEKTETKPQEVKVAKRKGRPPKVRPDGADTTPVS